MRRELDLSPVMRVLRRRRLFTITPIEAVALAIRWLAVAIIVAVWVVVALIVGSPR